MKICGWIDLIKGSAMPMNLNSCLLIFFSYCPLFIFILIFCPVHISKSILAMVMKFCGRLQLGKTGVSCDYLPLLFRGIFERFVQQTYKKEGLV